MCKSIYLAALLLVSGCGGANGGGSSASQKSLSDERVRPVKSVIATPSEFVERDFAGFSTPMMAVNLAFKISGQLLYVPVAKGQIVAQGEVLAKIDPVDVELQLSADRSTFEQARSQYDRAQRLLRHEAISQQEAESTLSSYMRARSAYENSEEMLQQTSIKSPFEAVVERVYVDTYQRVQAGETVVRIVSPTTTSVEFTLPESSLEAIKNPLTTFVVRFEQWADVVFRSRVVEYARTSSDASGFPVTLHIENPENYIVSSGMSCTITMRSPEKNRGSVVLPLSAIYSPTAGGTFVWIIGSDDRVELRSLEVERPTGERFVIVRSGVESGERVVTAGVYQLRENQVVKTVE
ncbi:MAG: efflux RND transporter periplasmic adaptor subunit [Rikenellaceae bacterium]